LNIWLLATVPGAVLWLIILLLPWRPWSTRERLESKSSPSSDPADLSDITVLIPARNEAEGIGRTLAALATNAGEKSGLEIVVIDDQSEDDTAGAARAAGLAGMRVIEGKALPDGWTGKLWALEQSLAAVSTKYTLLLDADIEVLDGIVGRMLELLRTRDVKMVSLMATLSMVGLWEKLLMPSFIYFFKLLYPFHLANSSSSRVAAAAGGTVLIETSVLREIGGFAALKDELIDDCALAAKVKAAGHGTWVGLSHGLRARAAVDLRAATGGVIRTRPDGACGRDRRRGHRNRDLPAHPHLLSSLAGVGAVAAHRRRPLSRYDRRLGVPVLKGHPLRVARTSLRNRRRSLKATSSQAGIDGRRPGGSPAAKRRKIHSLGRQPQVVGVTNSGAPRGRQIAAAA